MTIVLRPEIQEFVEQQVRSGAFASPDAVVEAAISQMQSIRESLDDETLAAINEAEEEADRGEGTDLDSFRAEMKKRFGRA